ncbi:hypothetical protein [Ornithinimicrobium kibberense]|uniref:hypothetical protein n=1 Tax=Ornithinimicrobium kibberense TaxID=282060 RepID=UPI0036063FBC
MVPDGAGLGDLLGGQPGHLHRGGQDGVGPGRGHRRQLPASNWSATARSALASVLPWARSG